MSTCLKYFVCLVTLTGAALAQSSTDQTQVATPASSSAPVAYVYVSRPTHVDAFAVSSTGKLTAVPGSPYAGFDLYHMSVTKKYLFGGSDDHKSLITYSIAANGGLTEKSSVDAQTNAIESCCFWPQRLDAAGATLYQLTDEDGDQALETFKVESNGDLQFIGNTRTGFGGTNYESGLVSVLGNDKFAYQTGCNEDVPTESLTKGYKRESTGLLQPADTTMELPAPMSGYIYCPYALANDASDHLAVAMELRGSDGGDEIGSYLLASYTADSHGNLTTKSTAKTMPTVTGGGQAEPMSVSPSGKLLAVAGTGFQVFHFNGADPITKYTGVLHSSENFLQFGWDKDNHLFALSSNALHVYSATSTSVKEVAGSPYSIPEASSVIVLSLQ